MARIPALLLGLRGGEAESRRALTRLRTDLGAVLLGLADEAAGLLAQPDTGRPELGGWLARRLAEIDRSHLGRSFEDVVDDVAARGSGAPVSSPVDAAAFPPRRRSAPPADPGTP